MDSEDLSGEAGAGEPGPGPELDWSPDAAPFEAQEKAWMLRLAREAIARHVNGGPAAEVISPPPRLTLQHPCFVTLTAAGVLRGCVGNVAPTLPLCQAVAENARGAASRDPRFPPVSPRELPELKIGISVLTDPQEATFDSPEDLLIQLEPGVTGVVMRIEKSLATFLPQVWAQVTDRAQFLDRLAEKNGFPPEAWREPGVSISLYKVQSFAED